MTYRGSSELNAIKSLVALLGTRRGSMTAIVSLGLLSSVFEGAGLYLLLPLINTLSGQDIVEIEYPAVLTQSLAWRPPSG